MSDKSNLLFMTRVDECYESLSRAEKKVADFICQNIETVKEISAQKLANLSGTGPATVVRFCKSCGFSGFLELKTSLRRETIAFERMGDFDIEPNDSVAVIKQKVLTHNSVLLENIRSGWDEEALERAAEALGGADRIVISGHGDSSIAAIMLQNNLSLQNKIASHTLDQVHEIDNLISLQPGDVFTGFTYTGRYKYLAQNFKAAKELGITTIGILGVPNPEMEKYIDIPLYTCNKRQAYHFTSYSGILGDVILVEILSTILAVRFDNYSEHQSKMQRILEQHRLQKNEKI